MFARILGPFRYFLYLAAFLWAFLQMKMAAALDVDKPSVMQGGGDTSEIDAATTSIVELGLYIAYSVATVGIVVGLVLCVPIIGKQDLGLKTLKGSIIVIIIVGAFHALLGFVGGLTG